ncbi:FG-GAP-like repeat-containing protein [Microbacterium invictum]|uniref:Murein DD-endopeptidase MepM/ murein hydrolase activator NlpD n=1 Tax=Microbacterium invictum TaxID=515415 RepID=A0AA40SPD4_9MICO|nr:FG-GAP-like repeat-containing protein [Microbacterium invictum]MBB4139800.1 murein DD-endopeptidase MepM/ murein hydrolase activator NlpD [Microbacterium invictum]
MSPTPAPSPTPTAEPEDDHENDGPTGPLTRELPPGSSLPMAPMRLTVPQYGPQPVFRFPFAPGQRWGASGSHSDSDGIHRGAIDFAPLSAKDKNVRAVAAGTVYRVTCSNGWFLGIDHGGGWMSEYYHLSGANSSLVGKWVEAGAVLGRAGQTLPCGGTPGASPHVHLSILNAAVDVPSGKRHYVAVSGIQFDNYTLRDSSGAYNGVWRNLSGTTVLTSRGVTCCLTASSRVGPTSSASLPDTNGNGIDDYSEATKWDTDLNADGRPDLVAFGGPGAYTALNSGTTLATHRLAVADFGTSKGWNRAQYPRVVIDVTGDGRSDIVGFGAAGVYVSVGTGSSFGPARRWVADFGTDKGWRVGVHQRVLADVTGDGLPDVVGFGGVGIFVARNTGSSFAAPTVWGRIMGSAATAGGWTESRYPRTVIDVTGDGRADVVGFGAKGVYVARNTGSGFAAPALWVADFGTSQGWKVGTHPRYVSDVNDDGRPDIIGFGGRGAYVSLNTGTSFRGSSLWSSSFGSSSSAGSWRGDRHPRTLADVNGDGRPDIVGFASTGAYVALNRGTSFAGIARWTMDFGATEWTLGWMPRSVVDVNRDGRADIVGFARDGVHVALSTGSRFGAAAHWAKPFGWDGSSGGWRVASHPRAIAF